MQVFDLFGVILEGYKSGLCALFPRSLGYLARTFAVCIKCPFSIDLQAAQQGELLYV